MKNLFLISGVFICLFSCKTATTETANQYTTLPEIGRVTTDLPRYSKPPVQPQNEIADKTPITDNKPTTKDNNPPSKKNSVIKKDTVIIKNDTLSNKKNNTLPEKKNDVLPSKTSIIQTVNTSRFSWEIGIRATQILDVRTPAEFKSGHIYDAININLADPNFNIQIQSLDKNSPVAVYCRSGVRSLKAAQILEENGFQIIYNLEGGLNQWIKDKKEIVK